MNDGCYDCTPSFIAIINDYAVFITGLINLATTNPAKVQVTTSSIAKIILKSIGIFI